MTRTVILKRAALVFGALLLASALTVAVRFKSIMISMSSDPSYRSTVRTLYSVLPFSVIRPVADECLRGDHEAPARLTTLYVLEVLPDEAFIELQPAVLSCMRSDDWRVRAAAVVAVLKRDAATPEQLSACETVFNASQEDKGVRFFAGLVLLKAAIESGDACREERITDQLILLDRPRSRDRQVPGNP